MAANPRTFAEMTQTILKTLADDPKRVFTQEHLCRKVREATQYKDATINLAIKALVVGGAIGGQIRGAKAILLSHRDPVIGDKDAQQAMVDARAKFLNDMAELKSEYEAKLKKAAADLDVAKGGIAEIHLKSEAGKTIKVTKGLFHATMPKVVQLAQARKNIFIYGPTGCGKSHVCHQVADALGLRFAFVSCTSGMSEGILGGRLLPVGAGGKFEYVVSEFIDCYENGGLFLLDEIDAADPNVLLLINAALANGRVAVSNRPGKPYAVRHKDFVCVAAANTVGLGADRMYSGRNKLDAATLDRFLIGKVVMGYDERVEADLCPDEQLRTRLQRYRRKILEHRLERAMSTRFIKDAYDMAKNHGWGLDDVDNAFFSGWREDEINKVKGDAA